MDDNEKLYIESLFNRHPEATKVIFDSNIFNYAVQANNNIGVNLFAFLAGIEEHFNWYIIQFEADKLMTSGNYRADIMEHHMLPCEDVGIKKIEGGLPHINSETGELEFWNLNNLSYGDYMQIALAHNFPELHIITNDSKLFKSGHAVLDGRVTSFHAFINEIPYWKDNKDWRLLRKWFNENIRPLRNNSSWKLEKKGSST